MEYKVNTGTETTENLTEALKEKRPLPLGMTEFEAFFERIWNGAVISGEPGMEEELKISARNVLANEIIHLPSGQTHESDIYFINRLRKVCTNQVCLNVIEKTKAELVARNNARKNAETQVTQ